MALILAKDTRISESAGDNEKKIHIMEFLCPTPLENPFFFCDNNPRSTTRRSPCVVKVSVGVQKNVEMCNEKMKKKVVVVVYEIMLA